MSSEHSKEEPAKAEVEEEPVGQGLPGLVWFLLLAGAVWGCWALISPVLVRKAKSEMAELHQRLEIREITASALIGTAPIEVDFHAEFAAGPKEPATFRWEFGNGLGANERAVRCTYRYGGRYTVRLTVIDGDGRPDTETLVVSYTGLPQAAAAPKGNPLFSFRSPLESGSELIDKMAAEFGDPPDQWLHFGDDNEVTIYEATGRSVLLGIPSGAHLETPSEPTDDYSYWEPANPKAVSAEASKRHKEETGASLVSLRQCLVNGKLGTFKDGKRVVTVIVTHRK